MALPSSGQITLNQVNVELGLTATAQIGMNDSAVRGLFGIASGEIEMSDGYGKANTTPYHFLVIAGGGSSATMFGGGGGAGGFRTSYSTSGGGASAETEMGLTEGSTYTVTVGAGGAAWSQSNT